MNIFIPLVGQFTNIGDTLHRSVIIDWFKEGHKLHLYVGKAPESFIAGLYLPANAVVYRGLFRWLFMLVFCARSACFIYNPGEITGTKKRFLKEVALSPFLLFYRSIGRGVLKVGVDIQERGSVDNFLYRITNFMTTYTFYRTLKSCARFGRGKVIPDLGFYRYAPAPCLKRYISISMRDDCYKTSDQFLNALAQFSKSKALTIAVTSQVRMDNGSGAQLSSALKRLGCDVVECFWPEHLSHAQQEARVNAIYAESLLAVSDRLHVLIAASNCGAIPLCIASHFSSKVKNHFEVIAYGDLVFDYCSMNSDSIIEVLEVSAKRAEEIGKKMKLAKDSLNLARKEVLDRCFDVKG